jgi:glycosyltransferase involved in cell wall biosynthesis
VTFPLGARRAGARVIHTQYNLSPLAGRRGITTIHDVSFFIGPEWFRHRDLFLLRRFVPASARRAARVITVSETSRSEIERFIPAARGKTVVTPLAPTPGLEPVPLDEARRLVEAETGIAEPFLLTVGTRWPRKNMGLAVEAVSGLPADIPHVLAVTGKPGWGEEHLASPRVRATGYVTEAVLSALYSSAALYLAPSRHEGFGLPVLDAFRCGCPVLCSAGGALPEVAGDAAVVLPSWSPADWTDTLRELLTDSGKLDAMRMRGLERVKQFDWMETARRTMAVYREVGE